LVFILIGTTLRGRAFFYGESIKNTELFHIAQVLNVAGEKCDVMINGTLKIEGVRQLASHSATF
jgi:hypothetical protein